MCELVSLKCLSLSRIYVAQVINFTNQPLLFTIFPFWKACLTIYNNDGSVEGTSQRMQKQPIQYEQ